MTTRKDTRPRHQQIAAELRADIMAGRLPPSTKLPSTKQLMERFATVNQTVQNALGMLKAEGYLTSHKGKGVYVGEQPRHVIVPAAYMPPADPGKPYPWITEASRRGVKGGSEILEAGEVPAPVNIAAAFKIAVGAPIVLRKRVMLLDDAAAELVWSYYPADIARGTALTERKKIKGGAPRLLADMGIHASHFINQVIARMPTPEEVTILDIPEEVPVIGTLLVVYAEEDRPIEATEMVKAAHLHALQYSGTVDRPEG